MTKDEALKLALEALENSVDLVVQDAYNAEQLYGNYPTRQGKVGGLKVLAEQHKQAITAIKEALAQPEQGWTSERIAGMARLKKAQDKKLSQPEQEPVATDWERIARVQDAKLRAMCNEAGGFEKLCEVMDKYERTTPPQRKPLTDEEIAETLTGYRLSDAIDITRAIEAKLKEKNT